jgi:hypothetical protein
VSELARIEDIPVVVMEETPAAQLQRKIEIANILADVLNSRKLYHVIQGKKHVSAEGWQVLAALCDLSVETIWTHELEDGWEARVEVKDAGGRMRGSAEHECRRSENRWAKADSYALRSMAQTRATSRAVKQAAGFVVKLAGFSPTPAEEMPA